MNPQSIQSSYLQCASCGASEFSLVFEANDFDTGNESFSLYRCPSCKLVHTSPMLTDSELSSYYKPQYYGKGKQKFSSLIEKWTISSNLRLAGSIAKQLKIRSAKIERSPRVLDIGCGRGNLLKAFSRLGFECYGVERAEFPDLSIEKDIKIYKGSLEEAKFDDRFFDVVILWHVLEHLSNPAHIISEIYRVMDSHGILIIAVPNFGSFQSRLFKKFWFHLDLPRHLYHFENESLNNLLISNNFKTVSVGTRSIDQSIFGFIQSSLNALKLFAPNSFYEQLKLPLLKRKISFYVQLVLSVLITPFAAIDYILSALASRGSCLIVTTRKILSD